MTPLLQVLAALGLTLHGFTTAQLAPISVTLTNDAIYAGTSASDATPRPALAISCLRGRWEGPSCPDAPGPQIVVDVTRWDSINVPLEARVSWMVPTC